MTLWTLGEAERYVVGIPLWLVDTLREDVDGFVLDGFGLTKVQSDPDRSSDWYAKRNGLWILRGLFALQRLGWLGIHWLYRRHTFPAVEGNPGRYYHGLALWREFRPWKLRF